MAEDQGHLFDQTPKKREKRQIDRISALPDELLRHVMSFLDAWEVVRTCVLSRRWRCVWASAPCLYVHSTNRCWHSNKIPKFVTALLLFRKPVPLDTFRLCLYAYSMFDPLWIQYAVQHNVRVLEYCGGGPLQFELRLPISHHLKRLTLTDLKVDEAMFSQLNSQCPVLEDLELSHCHISIPEIFLGTVRKLAIIKCGFGQLVVRVPGLIRLRLAEPYAGAASFKNLLSLVDASISLKTWENCNILEGLSNAQTLELLAPLGEVILDKELERCPTFSNLKTLSLGGWCMGATSNALVCLLRHSHVLEKLILHLNMQEECRNMTIMGDGWEEREALFTCKYLKMVEIRCSHHGKKIQNLVNFLHCNGISHEQIKIKEVSQDNEGL